MLHRRQFLIGSGIAALGACAAKVAGPGAKTADPGPSTPVPTGDGARLAPFADGITIDGASALDMFYGYEGTPDELAKMVRDDLAAAKGSGLSAVVATVAPQGQFWLDDAAFEKTK